MSVSEPSAGFGKGFAEVAHNEVDGATVCIADEASKGVATRVVGEAGMVVVVKGAQALVACHMESEALGNLLNRDGA